MIKNLVVFIFLRILSRFFIFFLFPLYLVGFSFSTSNTLFSFFLHIFYTFPFNNYTITFFIFDPFLKNRSTRKTKSNIRNMYTACVWYNGILRYFVMWNINWWWIFFQHCIYDQWYFHTKTGPGEAYCMWHIKMILYDGLWKMTMNVF